MQSFQICCVILELSRLIQMGEVFTMHNMFAPSISAIDMSFQNGMGRQHVLPCLQSSAEKARVRETYPVFNNLIPAPKLIVKAVRSQLYHTQILRG